MNIQSVRIVIPVLACTFAVACNNADQPDKAASQANPAAKQAGMEWQAELSAPMKAVLDEHAALGPKPIESLSPEEARKQPTPADAVASLLKKQGKDATPEPVRNVEDRQIPGAGGAQIPVRVYTPEGDGPFPVLVYIHGGGWVIATIDTYDSSARALCNAAKAVVLSVEYRKGPEHKFPAAHEDCFAAYQWALKNAAEINGDARHVDVAGESAGGNMAVAVALMARDRKAPMPKHILSVYPVAQLGGSTPSIEKYAMAKPLNKPMLAWFGEHYMKTPADAKDPNLGILSADLKGLPPTTIVAAQIDPLLSEGKMLADKLEAAGVKVRYRLFEGVTHEFFGTGAVVPDAKKAVAYAAEGLK